MFDKSFHCFWRRHRPFEGLFHTWNNGEDNFNVQHEEDILLYFRHLVYVFLCNSFPCVVVDVPAAFQRGKCCYRHERKRKVRWRPLSERCILLSKIKYNWENWKRVIEQAPQWDDDVTCVVSLFAEQLKHIQCRSQSRRVGRKYFNAEYSAILSRPSVVNQ